MKYFSSNLIYLREKMGLTQKDAAKKLGYKNASNLTNYEKGTSMPSLADTVALAKFYDVVISDLLDHDFKLGEPDHTVRESSPGYGKSENNDHFTALIIDSLEEKIAAQKRVIDTLSTNLENLETKNENLMSMLRKNYMQEKPVKSTVSKEDKK